MGKLVVSNLLTVGTIEKKKSKALSRGWTCRHQHWPGVLRVITVVVWGLRLHDGTRLKPDLCGALF